LLTLQNIVIYLLRTFIEACICHYYVNGTSTVTAEIKAERDKHNTINE